MSRAVYTASGAFGGAIFVLLLVLATREHPAAYAMQDNAGNGMLVTTVGGTQGSIDDTLYVIYRRQDPRLQELYGEQVGDQRLTLAVYRIEPGRFDLVLENARDITLDMQVTDYQRHGRPDLRVSEMRDQLRRQQQDDNNR